MRQRNFGFTIIELLVVIGLAAILLTLALSGLATSRVKARDNVRVTDIQNIRMAVEHYRSACGVYPARLEVEVNNGRSGTCSARLGDFIRIIPTPPVYHIDNINPQQENEYLYTGLSTQTNGPCYDYHIAVQLEYGADNNYADGENSEFFDNDHDYNPSALDATYRFRCAGADPLITDAHNDASSGLYDFRGSLSESQ